MKPLRKDAEASPWDLELHESMVVRTNDERGAMPSSTVNIMRVPGGWLYDDVFVPFISRTVHNQQIQ